MAEKMRAAIFIEPGKIILGEKPVPDIGPTDALLRITLTTICGTDVHIMKGEYPVDRGRTVGHEPVGVIEKLGSLVKGYAEGQRVIAGAITPSGSSYASLSCDSAQCGGHEGHGWQAAGGWRLGNTLDGAQAEYVVIPDAMVNLAPIPDGLTDEQVLMCPDILSTGLAGAESGNIRIGDTVAIFAEGPIGMCATMGARLRGAAMVIGVESIKSRADMAKHLGADAIVDFGDGDPVDAIMQLTGGRGVDVAIEALGRPETFAAALRVLRPGGTLSSLGVYSADLTIPVNAFAAGLGDHRIVTSLCPGGKERMRRLMAMVASGHIDTAPLITHHYDLGDIESAYDLFAHRREGVIKIALRP